MARIVCLCEKWLGEEPNCPVGVGHGLMRGTGDDVPVMEWELVDQRKELPIDLQQALGIPVRTIRVPKDIDTKIRTKHAECMALYEALNELLPGWSHAGTDPTNADTWQIYIPGTGQHWLAVVIGRDQNGSHNLISLFTIRDRNVRNRLKQGHLREKGADASAP